MKKIRILFWAIVSVSVAFYITMVYNDHVRENRIQQQLADSKVEIREICETYGIELLDVYESFWQSEHTWTKKGTDNYSMYIKCKSGGKSEKVIYNFVREMNRVHGDLVDLLIIPHITLDGRSCDVLGRELYWKETYTYFSDEEQIIANKVKNGYPYEGMDEIYINSTILGRSSSSKSKKFSFSSAQLDEKTRLPVVEKVTYTWKKGDEVIAEATVHRSFNSAWVDSFKLHEKQNTSKVPVKHVDYPSSSKGDPYDVHDYDDPDDFAADWEDEFDDYDDAWAYWEDHH